MVLRKLYKHRKRESIGKLSPLYLSRANLIRVTVGAGPPVLQVSSPVLGALPGYPDAAASVGHARAEVVDARGLVGPGQPSLVVLPLVRVIGLDVPDVMPGQFIYGSLKTVSLVSDLYSPIYLNLNFYNSIILSHLLRGKFSVGPSSFPFSGLRKKVIFLNIANQKTINANLHRLRVQSNEKSEILGDSVQEIARHPEIIPHLNPLAGTHLELPLGWHDLQTLSCKEI